MTILLLGATGRTGKWLLARSLEQGYTVHVLVRDKSKLQVHSPRLHVFEGVPTDAPALRTALQGCNAVINALNISRYSDFPWSKLRTPLYLLSDTMKLLAELCKELSVTRIIIISAWGVGDTRSHIPTWFRWFIDNSNIGPAYTDHERQEKILMQSGLEWTIVRPVGLTNNTKEKKVRTSVNNESKPSLTISRKGLAGFMITELEKREFLRQAVVVFQ
jgi:putative NADH-flavin reductase